jgi:hypothetical protein
VSQTGAAAPQSVLTAHATHALCTVSQMGVPPPIIMHWAFVVHAWATHWKPMPGSQMGIALPQSLFERHATHLCVPR